MPGRLGALQYLLAMPRLEKNRFLLHVDRCPDHPGDVADGYVLRQLSAQDAKTFEAHCRTCVQCRSEVRLTEEFIRALKASGGLVVSRKRSRTVGHTQ